MVDGVDTGNESGRVEQSRKSAVGKLISKLIRSEKEQLKLHY